MRLFRFSMSVTTGLRWSWNFWPKLGHTLTRLSRIVQFLLFSAILQISFSTFEAIVEDPISQQNVSLLDNFSLKNDTPLWNSQVKCIPRKTGHHRVPQQRKYSSFPETDVAFEISGLSYKEKRLKIRTLSNYRLDPKNFTELKIKSCSKHNWLMLRIE